MYSSFTYTHSEKDRNILAGKEGTVWNIGYYCRICSFNPYSLDNIIY